MARRQTVYSLIALFVLMLAGLICLYEVAFCVWMTAYRPEFASGWRVFLYRWLAGVIAIGCLWLIVAFGLWRKNRHTRS